MKSAELSAIGPAEKTVRCIEIPDPGAPGAGEVLVDVVACSINPADILMIEGNYASRPTPPCAIGIEGAGTVAVVGEGVTHLKVGDKVMSLGRTNWTQRIRDKSATFVRLPKEVDLAQAAMLKVNVATAHLMLTQYVELKRGDWVIQNAANSGVGPGHGGRLPISLVNSFDQFCRKRVRPILYSIKYRPDPNGTYLRRRL